MTTEGMQFEIHGESGRMERSLTLSHHDTGHIQEELLPRL
jgi:hypothetical protein